jgi:hypothetical protein
MSNTSRIFGIVLLVTAICVLLTSCQTHLSDVRTAQERYSGEGFRLMIPRCVSVKETERADYILYTFTSEGKGILGAYVGNQPNFLFEDRAIGPESITQLNGLPCKRVQARKQDGTLRTEVLTRFPRDRGWPMYIHFWYGSLEPEAKAMAEGIIASIAPQAEGAQAFSFPDPGGPDFPPVPRRTEDIIAEMERKLEEMKKQQGMTEEVKNLEAELKMRKDIHRQAEEVSRMAREEPEKWQQERERLNEEVQRGLISLTEGDLWEMKWQQGMTEEVKECETYLEQLKEEYRLAQEKKRKSTEGGIREMP